MATKSQGDQYILISTKTIFNFIFISIAVGVLLVLLYLIKEVVLLIFISLMLALALAPIVGYLVKKKVPRGVAVLIIYLVIIALFGVIGAVAIPPVINQTTKLTASLPKIIESIGNIPFLNKLSVDLNNFIAEKFLGASGNVLKVTVGAFSGILSVFSLMVITAYLLLDFDNVRDSLLYFIPQKPRKETEKVIKEIEFKLGSWLRGEFFLMCIVGFATYILLSILGIDYAAPLALIAGLLEVVPIIGPIISAVPGVIVGFSISPAMGFGTLAVYILVQQLENNFIVPKVMQKAIGFNPLITLVALLIGGRLFGVLGALLSVPITLIISIVIRHVVEYD